VHEAGAVTIEIIATLTGFKVRTERPVEFKVIKSPPLFSEADLQTEQLQWKKT